MAILDDVKISLRISSNAYDTEISDLISACKSDLTISGVTITDDTDTLIKRAINTYVKANFGWDNPDADRLTEAYNMLKTHLALTYDYARFKVLFTVEEADTTAIRQAYVTLTNTEANYDETLQTDENGQAAFYVLKGNNFTYKVEKAGFVSDDDSSNLIDVSANATVDITLTEV